MSVAIFSINEFPIIDIWTNGYNKIYNEVNNDNWHVTKMNWNNSIPAH